MHLLAHPIFAATAAAASAPAQPHGDIALFLLYVATVPAFVFDAVQGKGSIGWGCFQLVWLVLGIAAFWRWTDGCINGARLIGIYVVYTCLNLMCFLLFFLVQGLSHGSFQGWALFAFVLAAVISIATVQTIRGFPDSRP